MMKHLDGLLRLVDNEFNEMEQNGKFRGRDDVELASKLIDIAKDVHCIWDYEDKMQNMDDNYSYNYSYARKGNMMNRNSRGQFTNRMGYSRNDAKEEYIDQLRELMDGAPDDRTREHIQRMIRDMEQ